MKRIISGFLFCTSVGLTQVTPVVVPNDLASVEGKSSATDVMTASSFRLQMVFDAAQFSSLSSAAGVTNSLSAISFRIDGASTDHVLSLFGGSSVTVSITPQGPDNLSPIFADNIGANPVTIFNGALQLGAGYIPGASPQPFSISIISHPFYYSPSQGNLLLDIRGGGLQVLLPGALDAEAITGDSVSRVFAMSALATMGVADTLGLVTKFDFVVIPEPSSWRLIALGLLLALGFRRWSNKSLQPTPGSASSSAARFTSLGPAWLSSGR